MTPSTMARLPAGHPAGITAGAEAILALITRVELSRFYTRRAASQVTVLSPKARVAPMASCE